MLDIHNLLNIHSRYAVSGAGQSSLAVSHPAAVQPVGIGTEPMSAMSSSSLSADKYSAIADLESVFSTTSISGGFGFQSAAGVNWNGWTGGMVGGGGGSAMWGHQAAQYTGNGTNPSVNMGHRTVPQMYAVSSMPNSTAAPPSYSAVSGN